jgi:hypothetical protein
MQQTDWDPAVMDAESKGLKLVGWTDLNGSGDAMHVNFHGHYAYVGHMGDSKIGTSVVDISDPRNPRVLHQIEKPDGIRSHKVAVVGDTLIVNYEIMPWADIDPSLPTGFKVFSLEDPAAPREIAYHHMPGHGVHRMKFTAFPYAYLSGSDEGYNRQFFMIMDLSDPAHPREVSRWWLRGMRTGAGEVPEWHPERFVWHHHASIVGDRAYCAWWDAGVIILDISDKTAPKMVTHLTFDDLRVPPRVAGSAHTVLAIPEKQLLVVSEEELEDEVAGYKKYVRLIDISDETRPRQIGILPEPIGDYSHRGGRFGPHNLHEMRPGTLQNPNELYVTYFNAGVRVYDITDPFHPREVAYHVPPAPDGGPAIHMNDIIVNADGLIYATDRLGGGLYILERTDA